MSEIKTLVYFDLEATGLKGYGRPRITGLSFVAVNTQDLPGLNSRFKQLRAARHEESLENIVPRIMNKLTICIYPMVTVMPEVALITSLDKYNLSGQAKFDKNTGEMINTFLSRLPSPVCLVAHNGNNYDFPLLKTEMEKASTSLEPHILCADSYLGIKEIFKRRENVVSVEEDFSIPVSFSLTNLHTHFFGKPPRISHGSEADCFALLRVTAVISKDWLHWLGEKCDFIRKCTRMWEPF